MRLILTMSLIGFLALGLACQKGQNGNTAKNAPSGQTQASGQPNDSWITLKTKLALIADKRTSGFDTSVDTRNGVVTLSGKVDTDQAKTAATSVATGIKGVRSVDNELQVVPQASRKEVNQADGKINDAISKMMKDNPDFKSASLSASSNNGVVVVTGSVKNQRELLSAATDIRGIGGVRSVDTHQVAVKAGSQS